MGATVPDRRSETSRANLGDNIPQALDPEGAIAVTVRLPRNIVKVIDEIAEANDATRSAVIRSFVEFALLKA